MKLTALQIAAAIGFDVKVWQTFEKKDGKTVSLIDESKLGLRRGAHVPQDRYLSQLTLFRLATGLMPIGEVTRGKGYYWAAFDKAAFDAVSVEVLNLPITLTIVEPPAPKAVEADEDEDEIEEDEDAEEVG